MVKDYAPVFIFGYMLLGVAIFKWPAIAFVVLWLLGLAILLIKVDW